MTDANRRSYVASEVLSGDQRRRRWSPKEKVQIVEEIYLPGLNLLLGGGDVGKSAILDAIALLLNPTNAATLSDADYWQRQHDDGFEVAATMSLQVSCGIVEQCKAN